MSSPSNATSFRRSSSCPCFSRSTAVRPVNSLRGKSINPCLFSRSDSLSSFTTAFGLTLGGNSDIAFVSPTSSISCANFFDRLGFFSFLRLTTRGFSSSSACSLEILLIRYSGSSGLPNLPNTLLPVTASVSSCGSETSLRIRSEPCSIASSYISDNISSSSATSSI